MNPRVADEAERRARQDVVRRPLMIERLTKEGKFVFRWAG